MDNKVRDNIAYAISQINEIRKEKPGKKMLHKLLYLAQAEKVDLNLDYGIHFYGPYSSTLDASVAILATEDIVRFEYRGCAHLMEINDEYHVSSSLEEADEEKLREVIKKYKDKTPTQLELLTTTHYVKENISQADEKSIIAGVKKIKADKYSDTAIREAINELNLFAV